MSGAALESSNKEVREWVVEYFGERKGCLWELGAFDGETDSITRSLLSRQQAQWSGMLVEGNCHNYNKASRLYSGNDNVLVVHSVIGVTNCIATWWDGGEGSQESTTEKAHADHAPARLAEMGISLEYKIGIVGVLSVASLWKWWQDSGRALVDLVVCDLEGGSEQIVGELVKAGCFPEVIVVEAASPVSRLEDAGYRVAMRVHPDIVYINNQTDGQ